MKVIKKGHTECYRESDIRKELTRIEFKSFSEWIFGSTVMKEGNEFLIYKQDYDSWKSGRPTWLEIESRITGEFKKEFIKEFKRK